MPELRTPDAPSSDRLLSSGSLVEEVR